MEGRTRQSRRGASRNRRRVEGKSDEQREGAGGWGERKKWGEGEKEKCKGTGKKGADMETSKERGVKAEPGRMGRSEEKRQ